MNFKMTCVALAGAALLTAGCGTSDEDKVADTLKSYNAALVDGDGSKACGLFDDAGRKRLVNNLKALVPSSTATGCEQIVRDVSQTITTDNGQRIKAIAIRDVKIDGDKATAMSGVKTDLVKQGGDWKITNFAGSRTDNPSTAAAPDGCTKVPAPQAKSQSKRKPPAANLNASNPPTVTMETNCGSFSFKLDPKASPKAAASVAALARAGFYDGTFFHRIVPGFVIQGGDPTGSGGGGAGYTTIDKPAASTSYTEGTVAMAKGGSEPPGAASSQFFVVTGNKVDLPPLYAVVGKVTKGQDVVDRIGKLGDQQERPTFTVVVKNAKTSSGQ